MSKTVIEGACLCGKLSGRLVGEPAAATVCNCTACRRYGVIWAYGHEGETIVTSGEARAHVRGENLGFLFCAECGCAAWWKPLRPDAGGRRRMGVNLRTANDPGAVSHLPLMKFDGLAAHARLPGDGRCVRDVWF